MDSGICPRWLREEVRGLEFENLECGEGLLWRLLRTISDSAGLGAGDLPRWENQPGWHGLLGVAENAVEDVKISPSSPEANLQSARALVQPLAGQNARLVLSARPSHG